MMGKFTGKPYLMVKTMVSGFDFPLNQPNEFDKKKLAKKSRDFLRLALKHVGAIPGYPGMERWIHLPCTSSRRG
jgi:hypothetical protein